MHLLVQVSLPWVLQVYYLSLLFHSYSIISDALLPNFGNSETESEGPVPFSKLKIQRNKAECRHWEINMPRPHAKNGFVWYSKWVPFNCRTQTKKTQPQNKTKKRKLQQGTASCVSERTDTLSILKLWTNYLFIMKKALTTWYLKLTGATYKHSVRLWPKIYMFFKAIACLYSSCKSNY